MYRAVIIGAGRMGQRYIKILELADIKLVGISDIKIDTLSQIKNEYKIEQNHLFTDSRQMLEACKPDLVVIATTADAHCQQVLRACQIDSVKYILCEKPMATSVSDCKKMIDLCKIKNIKFAVNHQGRYIEQNKKIKVLIDAQLLGELNSITVVAGNFGLAMNGSHYIELLRFITGEFPVKGSALLADDYVKSPRGLQFNDHSGYAQFVTQKGKKLLINCDENQGHGITVIYAGRNGQLIMDELTGDVRITTRKKEDIDKETTLYGLSPLTETTSFPKKEIINSTSLLIRDLINGNSYPTGEQGMHIVMALDACFKSHQQGGKFVHLDEEIYESTTQFSWA